MLTMDVAKIEQCGKVLFLGKKVPWNLSKCDQILWQRCFRKVSTKGSENLKESTRALNMNCAVEGIFMPKNIKNKQV